MKRAPPKLLKIELSMASPHFEITPSKLCFHEKNYQIQQRVTIGICASSRNALLSE